MIACLLEPGHVIRQDGVIVGEHARCFERGRCLYDPWHYVPVLARKPGALRNGAPFKDWLLPANLERVRRPARRSTRHSSASWQQAASLPSSAMPSSSVSV